MAQNFVNFCNFLQKMPVFLKYFEEFCIFLIPVLTLWISPGLLIRVIPAFFLVYPAKECHPWTLSPFLICHPSLFLFSSQRKLGSTRRRRSGYRISPLPHQRGSGWLSPG
jgi:hypothetical protein